MDLKGAHIIPKIFFCMVRAHVIQEGIDFRCGEGTQRVLDIWNKLPGEMVESHTITLLERLFVKQLNMQSTEDKVLMQVNGLMLLNKKVNMDTVGQIQIACFHAVQLHDS